MADEADHADRLRETLLAVALVPLAGYATAAFWLRESLDRTAKLGGDVVASVALARFTRTRPGTDRGRPDPASELLALDLLESARTYVRSMVRLPADAGVYFTGELEARFNALLERIQPEAEKNLIAYADTQLQQLRQEVDRLLVLARAEVGRPLPAALPRVKGKRARATALKQLRANRRAAETLIERVEGLRRLVERARPKEGEQTRADLALDTTVAGVTERFTAARARTRARVRLQEALREAETLVPGKKKQIARLKTLVNEGIPSPQPSTSAT